MPHAFEKIWIDQCDAAEGLAERFGTEEALHYLIGEKFLNFLRASDSHPEFARELPHFAARVMELFEPHQVSGFLEELLKGGSAEQDGDWPFDHFEDADVDAADVVEEAQRIVRIERARDLLLA